MTLRRSSQIDVLRIEHLDDRRTLKSTSTPPLVCLPCASLVVIEDAASGDFARGIGVKFDRYVIHCLDPKSERNASGQAFPVVSLDMPASADCLVGPSSLTVRNKWRVFGTQVSTDSSDRSG
ncbi:hypothetical protein PENARI_c006G11614 [Penicillium arizonense]|uniref:Uncharacterized protein n=1 Tax=Penicillium arizonense TaxID=1835702 RepID=A0A1F5LM53_PENAI|nr:hypothetical protein PENARI_c006G11614 [Penicillium arizonense]OGE54284.1 hypothetical protein PENARI_c006G11614 [Penicillium arizonense]